MSGWIRCRTCRTLGIPERTPFCPACGDELREDGGAAEAPEVERAAALDLRRSTGVLSGLGVMGVVGLAYFFFFNIQTRWGLLAILGLLVLGGGTAFFLTRRHDPKVAAAGRALLKGFAIFGVLFMAGVALILALFVYLFVACATGNLSLH